MREEKKLLSICIITKNEEKNIERCLESLMSYNAEIVVVDTGSSDGTREIACQYTPNVYDFVWCDDFAKAKNFAISKATNPFVMILDSDEYIESFDTGGVEQLLCQNVDKVGRIRRRNIFFQNEKQSENIEWINRIFLKEKFHYEGRIHEQITALDKKAYDTYQMPIVIGHTGYDLTEEERQKKAERNIFLLKQELERLLALHGVASIEEDIESQQQSALTDDISQQLPYIIYQLGKSYYMARDYEKACEYFSWGLSYDLEPKLEYVIDMVETYGYALINSGRAEEALFFENIYEEFGRSADFQFLMGIIYMKNARFEVAVDEFLKATEHDNCRIIGVNDWLAYYNIGVIYECIGQVDKAKAFYKKCGNYKEAIIRLQRMK